MSGPPLTVLVIDDNRHIRRLLREGFALEGFGVREAGTADAGFTWARLAAPDLVILDLELADIDGAEVIERLRSWSRMPIIVLSGRSNAADTARLLDLGAADYLVKPFELAELVSRARAALRNDLRAAAGALRVQVGPLSMDFARCTAELAGVRLELTPKRKRGKTGGDQPDAQRWPTRSGRGGTSRGSGTASLAPR